MRRLSRTLSNVIFTVAILFLLIASLVGMIVMLRRPRGPRNLENMEFGVLTVTGASERPIDTDKNGQAFCTISGRIDGPTAQGVEVYQRMVMGPGALWPEVGNQLNVMYKPGKARTSWALTG